jgi:hypothetical protein
VYWKATIVWLAFGVIAVALGTFRQFILLPRMTELAAHQIGSLMVAVVIGAMAWRFTISVNPGKGQALGLGLFWVFLTLLFEFGFFHYARGVPWSRLLADYNVTAGRLWVLVLLTELVTPLLAVLWGGHRSTG